MNEEEYIGTRLEDQINWYDKKSVWNQKWFKRLQVYQIIAAVLIIALEHGSKVGPI